MVRVVSFNGPDKAAHVHTADANQWFGLPEDPEERDEPLAPEPYQTQRVEIGVPITERYVY